MKFCVSDPSLRLSDCSVPLFGFQRGAPAGNSPQSLTIWASWGLGRACGRAKASDDANDIPFEGRNLFNCNGIYIFLLIDNCTEYRPPPPLFGINPSAYAVMSLWLPPYLPISLRLSWTLLWNRGEEPKLSYLTDLSRSR
jgi:hypothetical protein